MSPGCQTRPSPENTLERFSGLRRTVPQWYAKHQGVLGRVASKQDQENVNTGYANAARRGGLQLVSISAGFRQRATRESAIIRKCEFQGPEASSTQRRISQWVLYLRAYPLLRSEPDRNGVWQDVG